MHDPEVVQGSAFEKRLAGLLTDDQSARRSTETTHQSAALPHGMGQAAEKAPGFERPLTVLRGQGVELAVRPGIRAHKVGVRQGEGRGGSRGRTFPPAVPEGDRGCRGETMARSERVGLGMRSQQTERQ